ncbi:MAG: HesA/MoeB/ThiF family protein [Muribaculaceae bacterium]|nr:HesA/MoeB/ThiF family protein [Muribaculaceae bacterium]MDE6642687.1 HesA/MoeB/ThiF family protein [Muribaculaceae bacterium]
MTSDNISLSGDNRRRYSRNLLLPEIGQSGQIMLMQSSVLIVGAGALGSIVAMYLAGSGVGHIGICDFDTIDISNLQRQLGFTIDDIGKSKVNVLSRRLSSINSEIIVEPHEGLLRAEKAPEIFKNYDVIVEGSDNPSTKYMVTDIANECGKPCVLGGVSGFDGQVMTLLPGKSQYRDIFPDATPADGYTPCNLGGVLGPLPGIIGSIQATEVIKIITKAGETLDRRMLLVNALNMTFTEIKI